ncbi:MAG: caspase family protein [Parvibaculaceae bacterium]
MSKLWALKWLGLTVVSLWMACAHAEASDKREIYALLVGINDYVVAKDSPYTVTPLKGALNDIEIVKELLVETYGVPNGEEHIKVLRNEKATRSAITRAFNDHLIEKAKSHHDATFLFYFSGHGSSILDENNDEGDEFDETLLAYDSRGPNGTDIRDDEIEQWLDRLKQSTKNIVLIFDSCHSGTLSKDPQLISRQAPPSGVKSTGTSSASAGRNKDVGSIADPDRVYSIIASSLAEEVSNEGLVETADGPKHHGFLTYYLVQTLKRSPQLTYREAVSEAESFVHKHAPSQHPQAEGDFDRVVLGGIGARQIPYIPVLGTADGTISVAAGLAQGIQPGALLAVYSHEARELVGEKDKIADAIIIEADTTSARAKLVKRSTAVSKKSKVRLVSPYSVKHRLDVGSGISIAKPLKERLEGNTLLRFETDARKAAVSVSAGCLADGQVRSESKSTQSNNPCKKVYYISPRDQDGALHGFHVSAGNEAEALDSIVAALEKIARQENIRSLTNKVSPLAELIKASMVRVEVVTRDGKKVVTGDKLITPSGIIPLQVGDYFRFKIVNKSDVGIYYSIISLGSSGAVSVLGSAAAGERILPGVGVLTKPALKVGPPAGLESYVIVVTTSPANFRFLQQAGVAARNDNSSLGWLLDGLTNPGFKDFVSVPELDLDSWTTVRIDVEVRT